MRRSDITELALLTLHHKERWLAPPLAELGIGLRVTRDFDTDTLGTFSQEITRERTALECAIYKAELACQLTGCRFGLGSEGSFGGGPLPGFVGWNDELLVCVDALTGQRVVAHLAGVVPVAAQRLQSPAELQARWAELPQGQGWMLYQQSKWHKGLQQLEQVLALWPRDRAEPLDILPDFRAHFCPWRQQQLTAIAQQLAARLQSQCPKCQAIDFWRKGVVRGLPCRHCHFPTKQPKAYLETCECCGFSLQQPVADTSADPSRCDLCNP